MTWATVLTTVPCPARACSQLKKAVKFAGVTTDRQINVTDDWTPNEIHAGRITDTYWVIQAKLENGRVPMMFKMMLTPTEKSS